MIAEVVNQPNSKLSTFCCCCQTCTQLLHCP